VLAFLSPLSLLLSSFLSILLHFTSIHKAVKAERHDTAIPGVVSSLTRPDQKEVVAPWNLINFEKESSSSWFKRR
jgi:hypothetical protein